MSLFDDLLTKVQSSSSTSGSTGSSGSSSSTGGSGQQDPVVKPNGQITISESTPIVTNQEIRITPVEPPVVIAAPVEPPVITITEAPMIGTAPAQEESSIVNTTSMQVESPIEESSPLFEMTTSPVEESKDENSNNFMLTGEDTTAFMQEGFSKNEASEVLLGDDTMSSSPLFDMSDDATSSNVISSEGDLPKENPKVEDTVYKISSNETSYRNTKEYLKHAFEEVEVLIATIDLENENKIKEREGYKIQKEHFADLELQADLEHQKMLEERAHAKRMKAYLEHEQAKSELPPISKKTVVAKKVAPTAHAKKKVIKPRVHVANHTNFAQLA